MPMCWAVRSRGNRSRVSARAGSSESTSFGVPGEPRSGRRGSWRPRSPRLHRVDRRRPRGQWRQPDHEGILGRKRQTFLRLAVRRSRAAKPIRRESLSPQPREARPELPGTLRAEPSQQQSRRRGSGRATEGHGCRLAKGRRWRPGGPTLARGLFPSPSKA